MTDIVLSFTSVKRTVLNGLYRFVLRSGGAEWLAPKDVVRESGGDLPIVYVQRVLDSLLEERLVSRRRGTANSITWRITQSGILLVESEAFKVSMNTIPASDRIVALSHNGGPEDEIATVASNLSKSLLEANDKGQLTSDEAQAASQEVAAISALFKGTAVRASAAWNFCEPTLKWISSKAAEAAIGAAAVALLTLIAAFFGVAF